MKIWIFVCALCLPMVARSNSVYQISPWKDGALITAGLAGAYWGQEIGAQSVDRRCPCDRERVNSLDRTVIGNHNSDADLASDITLGLSVAAPVALSYWDAGWSQAFIEDMVVYAEVMSLNGALTAMTKVTHQRPRPETYSGERGKSGYQSFYSGHASSTFAALSMASMTWSLRHPDSSFWPWLISGVVGTSVALERVAAGKHFYSDVAIGAAMGTFIGVTIPWLHIRGERDVVVSLAPMGDGVAGLARWRY